MERIGLAALAGALGGTLLGILCLPVRRSINPWAVGRWSAFLLLLLFTWSALFWPARAVRLTTDTITVTHRKVVFGDLALPFSSTEPIALLPVHTWTLQESEGRTGLFLEQNGTLIEVGRTRVESARRTAAHEYVQHILP
jgi:hypothetical protein